MKRRMFVGATMVAAVVLLTATTRAGGPPAFNLLERLMALEEKVAALEAKVSALQNQLLAQASSPVMALSHYLSVDAAQHRVRFTGVNLQLVNGTGRTDTINGLGNLIIGYDLARDDGTYFCCTYFCSDGQYPDQRTCEAAGERWALSHETGSHYLVIGDRNNYSQYGGLVVGSYNTSTGPAASVTGGRENTASGDYASVSGGNGNTARGPYASVTGGQENVASGPYASVTGGEWNLASGFFSSVSGGDRNTASGSCAHVSGGYQRRAIGPQDWVAGELTQDK